LHTKELKAFLHNSILAVFVAGRGVLKRASAGSEEGSSAISFWCEAVLIIENVLQNAIFQESSVSSSVVLLRMAVYRAFAAFGPGEYGVLQARIFRQ
jgi:hypothetical protein